MEQFTNDAASTLNGTINSTTTTVIVTSASSFPNVGNFRILIDGEIMLVTAVSSNTFTVSRAQESTLAASHSNGASVIHILTAGSLKQIIADNIPTTPISVVNGGTGNTSFTASELLASDPTGIGAFQQIVNGTAGQPLFANSSGLPSFQNIGSSTPVGSVSNQGQGLLIGTFFDNGNCDSSTTQTTGQNLVVMMSADGINWNYVRPYYLYTPSTGMRDPSWYYDGTTYWIAYTIVGVGGNGGKWGIASSPDLINWTHVQDIDFSGILIGGQAVQFAWAPEWFIDNSGGIHIFLALGHVDTAMQLYETHPTTAGNISGTWSTGTPLSGSSLPTNMIDPFVLEDSGGTYYVFYKNNVNRYIEVMTSTSLTSGYTVQGSGHWMTNWPTPTSDGWEGPSIAQISSNQWIMWVDNTNTIAFDDGLGYQYSVFTGSSISAMLTGSNWSTPAYVASPFIMRHGRVNRVTDLVTMRNAYNAFNTGTRHPAAMVTGTTSILDSTTTALQFATLQWDDLALTPVGGYWSSGSNTKLTAPMSGMYQITCYVHWTANSTGERIAEIRINGTNYNNGKSDNAADTVDDVRQNATMLLFMDAGDYAEVAAYQTSGSALSQSYCNFAISRVN